MQEKALARCAATDSTATAPATAGTDSSMSTAAPSTPSATTTTQ